MAVSPPATSSSRSTGRRLPASLSCAPHSTRRSRAIRWCSSSNARVGCCICRSAWTDGARVEGGEGEKSPSPFLPPFPCLLLRRRQPRVDRIPDRLDRLQIRKDRAQVVVGHVLVDLRRHRREDRGA